MYLLINVNVLSIFVNLGDNVKFEEQVPNLFWVKANDEKDLAKSAIINKKFPDLSKKLSCNEKGAELFMKITKDINKHNQEDSKKVEKVYAPLQSSMLSTMNSHDEFIKRVKEKNNAPQK